MGSNTKATFGFFLGRSHTPFCANTVRYETSRQCADGGSCTPICRGVYFHLLRRLEQQREYDWRNNRSLCNLRTGPRSPHATLLRLCKRGDANQTASGSTRAGRVALSIQRSSTISGAVWATLRPLPPNDHLATLVGLQD